MSLWIHQKGVQTPGTGNIKRVDMSEEVSSLSYAWKVGFGTRWVTDFGGQSLDTDPNFGWYWHFYGKIIGVRTDKNCIKGVPIPILEKDAWIRIGYI